MKTITSILVAAALMAPAVAHAGAGSRINTPGTETRHEANLSESSATQTRTSAVKAEEQAVDKEPRKMRPRAALAGRVNVAARTWKQ